MAHERNRVLVIEDDTAIGAVVETILEGEGFPVTVVQECSPVEVERWIGHELPACVLLDGGGSDGFGESWHTAALLRAHSPPIPVVMFSADQAATVEARAGRSARSREAGFAAVLDKPFDLDALIDAVTGIVYGPEAGSATSR
ncbi:MAG TPA: response regulator [Chloroflexota bacterium]|nr:response regulator [Chloroflexota bacterium]